MAKKLMSRSKEKLLRHLLQHPTEATYGFKMATDIGRATGTLYPLLADLERVGWLESWWEDAPPPGRPRRRLYRLTATGVAAAQQELAALK